MHCFYSIVNSKILVYLSLCTRQKESRNGSASVFGVILFNGAITDIDTRNTEARDPKWQTNGRHEMTIFQLAGTGIKITMANQQISGASKHVKEGNADAHKR